MTIRQLEKIKQVVMYVTLVVMLAMVIMCGFVAKGYADVYPRTAVVTDIEWDDDLVIITDHEGLDWAFYGIEDWNIGDITSLIMDDMNTETIYDDEIVMIAYGGWMGLE